MTTTLTFSSFRPIQGPIPEGDFRIFKKFGLPNAERSLNTFIRITQPETDLNVGFINGCPKEKFWNIENCVSTLDYDVRTRTSNLTLAIVALIAVALLAATIALPILLSVPFIAGTIGLGFLTLLATYGTYAIISDRLDLSRKIEEFNRALKNIDTIVLAFGPVIQLRIEAERKEAPDNIQLEDALKHIKALRELVSLRSLRSVS